MDFTPFPQLEAALYRRSDEQLSSPLECHNHILQGSYLRLHDIYHCALHWFSKVFLFGTRSEVLLEIISIVLIYRISCAVRYIKRSLRPKDIGRYRLALVQVIDYILDTRCANMIVGYLRY